MAEKRPKLVRTRWGFYQYDPMPSEDELEAYYRDRYFQEGTGGYETSYSDQELRWKRLRAWLTAEKALELAPRARHYLDVGCGEGFGLAEFASRGLSVSGVDLSDVGIKRVNPDMLPHFKRADMMAYLADDCRRGSFDILSCSNVFEHVPDPLGLLRALRGGMREGSLLVITVPNDGSPLHEKLEQEGFTREKWWTFYPDHLSYFNKRSMTAFCLDNGLEVAGVLADNPIDLNLLNKNSNYVADPDKGRETHLFRIRTDLFLAETDRYGLLRLYEAYGAMGVGRNLTFYCRDGK